MNYYVKALQNYAGFSGRSNKCEYWYFLLFNIIISFAVSFIGSLVGMGDLLDNIYSLAVFIPSIAVSIRRMHDVNKSGWYLLIPIYNIILACTVGTKGVNQYGEELK